MMVEFESFNKEVLLLIEPVKLGAAILGGVIGEAESCSAMRLSVIAFSIL